MNAIMMFVCGLVGADCGTILVDLVGKPTDSLSPHSLIVAGEAPSRPQVQSEFAKVVCPKWELVAAVQKEMQHEYCTRHFDGEPRRDDIAETSLQLPGSRTVDFLLYKSADIVSGAIQSSGQWRFICRAG